MDHNCWIGLGRLAKSPEYFPPGRRGQAHAKFTLAVNRVVSNEVGTGADYIPCSLWGPEAEVLCNNRDKGDEVWVRGRVRTNFVPKANGDSSFFWEVRVDRIAYGRRSLKNMQPKPVQDKATIAVGQLNAEFGD